MKNGSSDVIENQLSPPLLSPIGKFRNFKLNIEQDNWIEDIFSKVLLEKEFHHAKIVAKHFSSKSYSHSLNNFEECYKVSINEDKTRTLLMQEIDNGMPMPIDRLLHIIYYSDMTQVGKNNQTALGVLLSCITATPKYFQGSIVLDAMYARSNLSTVSEYGVSIMDQTIDLYKKGWLDLSPRCWGLLIKKTDVSQMMPSRLKVLKEIVDLIKFDVTDYPLLLTQQNDVLKGVLEGVEEIKSKVGSNMFIKPTKPSMG